MSFRQALLYGLPVVWVMLIVAVIRWRTPQKWLKNLSLCGLTLALITSPSLVLFPGVRHSVDIPGYRVDFFEESTLFYFDVARYFVLYRSDGQRAHFLVDIDASRCMNLKTSVRGSRIYFDCVGDPQSRPAYIDTENKILFSGWSEEKAIADLQFSPPDELLSN